MMSASTNKIYFHHIPKTAGTSLRSYLADQYRPQSICKSQGWSDLNLHGLGRLNDYDLIMGHFDARLISFLNADFKLITFVRDPIERTISAINHAISDPVFRPVGLNEKVLSLEKIVFDPESMGYFTDAQVGSLSSSGSIEDLMQKYDPVFCKKAHPSSDDMIADYDLAIANLAKFDFIGISALFDQEVIRLADRYSFYPPEKAPALNIANKESLTAVSVDVIEEIRKYNILDTRLYDYVIGISKNVARKERAASLIKYFRTKDKIVTGIFLPLNSPFPGSGFYDAESGINGDLFRWSGPGKESRIAFNLVPSSEYRILISCFFGHSELGNLLNILQDDTVVASVVASEGLVRREFNLVSTAANDGITEITFSFSEPRHFGADLRQLGFMLCSLYITPFF